MTYSIQLLMANKSTYLLTARIVIIGVLFFLSIQLMGVALKHMGGDMAQYISQATANPFIGLFIGLLATAILQSSSTTTSMTVAAVAAGTLSLQNAIPIVMGANIGTTLTSTIVSMSYIAKGKEFRKALSAGSVHDIFNILLVIMLFPLEYHFGMLSTQSQKMTSIVTFDKVGTSEPIFLSISTNSLLTNVVEWVGPIFSLLLAFGLLFGTVKLISSILSKVLIGDAKDLFKEVVFKNTRRSFGWGVLLTSVIQSSSITSSLIVPLVATSRIKLKRAFQFLLGANLGTTITALLAALFRSESAISLAFAHFLFNAIGVLLFLALPFLPKLTVNLAKKLGAITLQYRIVGFAYIVLVFFILPFTLIYFSLR